MDSTVGALLGLLVAIGLIIKKVSPAYSLILGALIGGLAGGLSLEEVVASMTEGVKGVSSAVLRILTAGVLSGVLIKTGAAMLSFGSGARSASIWHWPLRRCCCVR